MRPAAKDDVDPVEFALRKQIVGVGWPIDTSSPVNWEEYKDFAAQSYENRHQGWWRAVNAVKNRMEIGDLCCMRDLNGIYYLGEIVGEWEYHCEEEYGPADLVNTRHCDWIKLGTADRVPGKVVASFQRGAALQHPAGASSLGEGWQPDPEHLFSGSSHPGMKSATFPSANQSPRCCLPSYPTTMKTRAS